MATVEDLAIQALARCAEFGGNYPSTRSVMYRRLGVRQQQLFSAAARVNPEYFGLTADGTLDANKEISLANTGDRTAQNPVPNMELISRIEVLANDGSQGAPAVGTEINVVPITDTGAALPPRLTIRGGTFAPVGTDFAQITQIRVFYSYRPFRFDPQDGTVTVELPEPFQDLLVLDLARFMLRKATTMTKEVREVALAALEAEEKESILNFEEHVDSFTKAVERGRFGRTQGNTRQ